MARVNGTILRVELTPVGELASPEDISTLNVEGTVFVAAPGLAPYPGLGIDLGTTDMDGAATLLAHSASDLYTLATTGSL